MKVNIEQPWIEAGYEIFAREGPKGLKVEQIARVVGKSKSSFYHLFADLEVFQQKLLEYHLQRAKEIAVEAAKCKNMVPDFINMGLEAKSDLLFDRQLRVHRDNPEFRRCFEHANTIVVEAFTGIWAEAFGLADRPHVALGIMTMINDNFFLQITEEHLNYDWLLSYFNNLQGTIREIIRNSNQPTVQ